MALTLQDMDNHTLAELDFFTIEELENMKLEELRDIVDELNNFIETKCNGSDPLTGEQQNCFIYIINVYNTVASPKENMSFKQFTIKVVTKVVKALTTKAVDYAIGHCDEIKQALIQAFKLLREFIEDFIN